MNSADLLHAPELSSENPDHAGATSIEGKRQFADYFVSIRDQVELDYYFESDQTTSAVERSNAFLKAVIAPALGQSVEDPERFYQTFGRLMRWAWLSLSVGIYDDDIRKIADAAKRLHMAQVNTVDITWKHAMDCVPRGGLIVEIGTGRGNSIARLAQLRPDVQIVTITISPEQAAIAKGIVNRLGTNNIEVRRGDMLDPATTADLIGQANAVGAIEVAGHFPIEKKAEGIHLMSQMLQPGGSISMVDTAEDDATKLPSLLESYYTNQSWYFGTHEIYQKALETAEIDIVAYTDYTANILQTFTDTTQVLRQHRSQLKSEFGWVMSRLWPEIPATAYYQTVKQIDYVHILGIKR